MKYNAQWVKGNWRKDELVEVGTTKSCSLCKGQIVHDEDYAWCADCAEEYDLKDVLKAQ
jgi:hypothetical protein